MFPENIAKFLRTALFMEHVCWLLLKGIKRNTLTITFPFKESGEGRYERLSLTGDLYSESKSGKVEITVREVFLQCFHDLDFCPELGVNHFLRMQNFPKN